MFLLAAICFAGCSSEDEQPPEETEFAPLASYVTINDSLERRIADGINRNGKRIP